MIRRLALEDLGQLAPLFADYLRFYGVAHAQEKQREFLADRLGASDSEAFGAFDPSGDMIGFALCHSTHNSLRLARAWTLHDLFVAPTHRQKGTARLLLDAVHDAARKAGACEVILSTAHDNRGAQALYESAGYDRDELFRTYVFKLH